MDLNDKTLKVAALLIIVLLIAAPLTYLSLSGDDDDPYRRTILLGPGEVTHFQVSSGGDVQTTDQPLPPFPTEVKAALKRTPGWLRPDLEKKFVRLSLMDMTVYARATPSFGDFDLDGDQDLVTGNQNGEVELKLNEGSQYDPIFIPTDLADGIGGSENAAPAIADLNGDGNTDLLMGSHDDVLNFYRNDGTNEVPAWTLDNSFLNGVNVLGSIFPRLLDYDGDNDLDLIVVEHSSSVTTMRYFENTGSKLNPSWNEQVGIFALLQPVIANYPFPAFYDLDNDGDHDVTLGGRDGRLRYFENRGTILATAWTEDDRIFSDINTGTRATPAFADLNGDSRIDLVTGEENGTFFKFMNQGTPEDPSFIDLNSGSIYYDTSALSPIGDVIAEARGTVLGPSTINVDRLVKEYDDEDIITFSQLINGAEKRYVDELAFIIANTNENVLRAMTGTIDLNDPECTYDPGILLDHVEEHYKLKGQLAYADIMEKGDYTTLWYISGEGEKKELPRDVYYWSVVHPRCRYEVPGYTHGDFWREYLRNDDQYSNEFGATMLEAVKESQTIHDAIYDLTKWMSVFMDFGYDTTDKTAIEIYDAHYGSCGEYSILRNAMGRSLFIPVRLANDWGEDHVWNEFYDDVENGTWHHWDGMADDPMVYERDWGKDISAVWTQRGDDLVHEHGVTEKYTDTAHITARIEDRNGDPVDGACVVMQSEYFLRNSPNYWPAPTIAIWNYTDENGECEFDLGGNYYTIDVMSEIGTFHRGFPNLAEGTPFGSYRVVEGHDDTVVMSIDGEVPQRPGMGGVSTSGTGRSVSIELATAEVVAQNIATFPDDTLIITGNRYPQPTSATIDVMVCDKNNFGRFMAGYDFDCAIQDTIAVTESREYDLPEGDWYVVICNRYCLGMEKEIVVTIG